MQLTCKNYPELHQNVEQEIERRANQTVGHKIFLDMYAEKSISAYEACLSYYDVFGMKFQGASYYPMRIYDYPSNESFSLVLAFGFVLSRESVSIALEMSDVFDNILVDPERSFQMAQLTITRVRTTDGGYYCIDPAYQQEINEWWYDYCQYLRQQKDKASLRSPIIVYGLSSLHPVPLVYRKAKRSKSQSP